MLPRKGDKLDPGLRCAGHTQPEPLATKKLEISPVGISQRGEGGPLAYLFESITIVI